VNTETIIFADSPEAAHQETVTLWRSRDGFLYQTEDSARYAGATHVICSNNSEHPPYSKNSYCKPCHEQKMADKFAAMPRKKWEGEPLTIYNDDVYFFDLESIIDYCGDHDCNPQDLQLVICEPNNARTIDSDYWMDELADDQKLPHELDDAVAALNEVIMNLPPISWSQGKYAAII